MGRYRKEEGIVSKAEARICLTCESKRCLGSCERLKQERKRLYKEHLPSPINAEEFDIPDATPWPKENPHTPQGGATK